MPRTSDKPPIRLRRPRTRPGDRRLGHRARLRRAHAGPARDDSVMLSGRDLLAQAATGTGKTAAFALPMLQRIAGSDTGRRTAGPRAGADARAGDAGGRGHPQVRPRRPPQRRPAVRRRVDAAADPLARARRQRRRRHAGARARSHPPQDARPRQAAGARPRRSGRDARHGLRGGPRRDPRGDAEGSADGAVLRDDAGADSCRSPSGT